MNDPRIFELNALIQDLRMSVKIANDGIRMTNQSLEQVIEMADHLYSEKEPPDPKLSASLPRGGGASA
jgi:hypothetical protein